jgi:hypothetical protein
MIGDKSMLVNTTKDNTCVYCYKSIFVHFINIPHPSYIHAIWSVGPNNKGQIELCKEDKDSLERGIRGGGERGERYI